MYWSPSTFWSTSTFSMCCCCTGSSWKLQPCCPVQQQISGFHGHCYKDDGWRVEWPSWWTQISSSVWRSRDVMSQKWCSIPRIATAKTPTQATLWPSASTRLDNARIILSQSVLSGCGHCSHPAEAQIWPARTAHVHATAKHFDCCWHCRHICISGDGRWPASHATGNDATTELASGFGGWHRYKARISSISRSQYVWPGWAAGSAPADNPMQQCWSRTQLLITASPENILAQLNESAATQSPGCSACTQGQTIQHWHWCHCTRVCCEVWESSRDIWTHLNCIAFCPWACSIPHPDIQWARLNYIWYYVCMRYYNIYLEHDACNLWISIKLNRFCFWPKNMRTGCKRQGQRMGEGWGGLATCVCNANEHGPLNFFSIVVPTVKSLVKSLFFTCRLVVNLVVWLYFRLCMQTCTSS